MASPAPSLPSRRYAWGPPQDCMEGGGDSGSEKPHEGEAEPRTFPPEDGPPALSGHTQEQLLLTVRSHWRENHNHSRPQPKPAPPGCSAMRTGEPWSSWAAPRLTSSNHRVRPNLLGLKPGHGLWPGSATSSAPICTTQSPTSSSITV